MHIAVNVGLISPRVWTEVAVEAERLGFESVWVPEHLVLPVDMGGSPFPGHDHPPIPPDIKVLDAWAVLAFLAARTSRLRLGTFVYNLALRHPFVSARAIATVDVLSGGRVDVGIGASWLESEWRAVGLDFHTRGRRLDETLDVCTRLWSERVIEHRGEFYDFEPVMFEPKPVQQPRPPVHVGGVSDAALRRAVRSGDGWIGMNETFEGAQQHVERLRRLAEEYDRPADRPLQITVGGDIRDREDVAHWEEVGVTRLIVGRLGRPTEAVDKLRRIAERAFG